jgi:GT2 family glycosyltransferase
LKRGAKYIALLNDDTAIIDADWLSEAVELVERNPEIGMVGFKLHRSLPRTDENHRAAAPSTPANYDEVHRLDGCALFTTAPLLKRIGLFDEVYFAYAEEDDLECRAARIGMRIVELDRRIYHFGGGTSKRFPAHASYLQMRNFIRYSIKNRSLIRTFARVCRIFDVACNPCSISFDPNDETHTRMRGDYAFLRNLKLFSSAVIWNVLHFFETFSAGRQDRIREQGKL